MSEQPQIKADQLRLAAVRDGRAMVKVIEGLQVLKENPCSWRETLLINLTLSLYQHRLRQAILVLPPEVSAEILAAAEEIKDH